MNRTRILFVRVMLLTIFITGWCNSAWAARLMPTFDTSGTNLGASHWYLITFINKGANQNAFARTSDSKFRYDASTPTNDYKWRFVGSETDFVIQSASGYYVYNPQSGTGNNTEYQITTAVGSATHFKLINGTDADSWAFQRISNGGGSGNCMNPRSGDVREWSNDGGCRIRLTATEIEIFRWTVNITSSDGIDVSSYKVRYRNAEYPSGTEIELQPGETLDGYTFRTTCNDKFVWGPVVDNATSSVNFDVRSTATTLTPGKFYQMVLRDKSGQVFNGSVQSASSMVEAINGFNTLRHKGQYIYVITAGDTGWTVELTGNYNTVKESATYVYVDGVSGSNVSMKMQNGQHVNQNGQGVANGTIPLVYQSATGAFRWNSNALPWNNLRNSKVGIGNTGSASSGNMEFFFHELNLVAYTLVARDQNDNDIPTTNITYKHDNGLAMDGKLYVPSSKTSFSAADFVSTQYSVEEVTLSGTTINLRVHAPTIIHRQHAVFDHLHSVAQKPNSKFIQDGEGMIPHPYASNFIDANGYEENDRMMQNTSVFHVTQYTKPGTRTECILPFTKNKSTGDHLRQYQRWYNYKTERPLSDAILRLDNGNSTLGNFNVFVNGHCNYNSSGSRQYDVLGKADVKLPVGSEEIFVGVDASEFQDFQSLGNGDIVEPSLNMRVVYHIISAHEMARELTTSGEKWWEAKEYFVPNIKRGSDTYKNNADLIPLDMPFSNYWIYKTSGNTSDSNLMPIVAENGNYNTLRSNIEIVVEGTATDNRPMSEYLEVGVFDGNPGNIGSAPYINGNHFLYYKVKGASATRIIPSGSQAVIKVYAKDGSNGSSPKYQLFKFTLNFQGATEPLAITSVVGNPASTRSVDYFIKNDFKESASLTFKNKDTSFIRIPGWRNDGNEGVTYAFPIDFSRTSYGYSPSNTYGNYRITTKGYGIQYRPVSLYERNIDNSTNSMMCSDDYFFYIDAAESPGQVASITLDGTLCVGSRLFCYGWLGSSNYYNGAGNPSGASVLLQVVGRRSNGTEEVIASYLPGTLTDVSYDEEGNEMRSLIYANSPSQQQAGWMDLNATQVGVWNSVGFSFVVKDVAFVSYDLRIINNCYSTAGGDYVLDDFRVFVSPPKGNVDFTTPLCTDAMRHVKVHTDYDMLVEASSVNVNAPGAQIPVSFCFLNKDIYDEMTKDYYDVDSEGKRILKDGIDYEDAAVKNAFNTAFGEALIGERTIDKNVKGHGFHNFVVPVDYESIPEYAYNDSPADQIFKEEKDNGERRIVFKEQIYQSTGAEHQWEPGKSYYLLFAPYHVTDAHLAAHDVGTEMFHVSDVCCVLTTFTIMPPIEVKGDATITSSDHVQACDNQVVTFTVDLPALKLNDDAQSVNDAVISGLNYDWWVGTSKANATHAGFLAAQFGTYASIEDARRYNHKSVDDYPDDADVDRNVYLESALENMRFYFPEARTLDEVSLVAYDNDNGYGIVQEHLDCLAHYLAPLSDGRKPLSLFGQTFNLKVSHAEADANNKQHFVAIPIIPEQNYGVDEKLIYCPAPQELIIEVGPTAPNMQNGFAQMTYPDYILNVPVRMGKEQIENVKKDASADVAGYTLNIPLRKIIVTGSNSTELIAKDHDTESFGSIFLTATDDAFYSFDTDGGAFRMQRVAQVIDIRAPKNGSDAYMKIAFTNNFIVHEGCTYTLKLPYVEDEECECEGTLVFDIKVVPEYQVWTSNTNSTEWTDDTNWKRADATELHADNATAADAPNANGSRLDTYTTNLANKTGRGFVPMYFTNVLLHDPNMAAPSLYAVTAPSLSAGTFLGGLANPSDIIYDLEATPVVASNRDNFTYTCDFGCELFGTNLCRGITFQPGTMMGNTYLLDYKKAWVEYELDANRWYTIATPLKNTYAGDWYSPTHGGKQVSPHFHDITYSESLNDRFRPAYYQRSWDREGNNVVYLKTGGTEESYVKADWSFVYNDADVNYNMGGFSVKADLDYMTNSDKPADGKVLVRLPKADTSYTYYDLYGNTGQAADAQIGARQNRLLSDDLGSDGTGTISVSVTNHTADNNYFLVSNPFMAPMDMNAFFAGNTNLEQKYWIVDGNHQAVAVKSLTNGEWISTSGSGHFVAPLQSFFVKMKDGVPGSTLNVSYLSGMQSPVNLHSGAGNAPVILKAPTRAADEESNNIVIKASREGFESTAIVAICNNAQAGFVTAEDCEAFVDGNLYDQPTVYTSAAGKAMTINTIPTLHMLPLGVVSSNDDDVQLEISADNASFEALYLFDAEENEYTPIDSNLQITISGDTSGRYFITTTTEVIPEANDSVRKGVWTMSGIYLGKSVKGLQPGLYIVDGVKMVVK